MEGLSYREIGDQCGCTKYAVAKFARQCGSPLRNRTDVQQAHRELLQEIDDGSDPAWMVATEVGCGENLVRIVRKERGMKGCVRTASVNPSRCPRCEFPPSQENPMVGWACLWCWCDLLSNPRYVPRGQRICYQAEFCESGLATRAGLVPDR